MLEIIIKQIRILFSIFASIFINYASSLHHYNRVMTETTNKANKARPPNLKLDAVPKTTRKAKKSPYVH